MGRPEIKVPDMPFAYGGDPETLCRECQLPCKLDETSVDCFRRFFLQGLLQCTYFVHGYCFLVEKPGCVFDNGGEHDTYWMNLLNQYFHNVKDIESNDPDFVKRVEELKRLIADQLGSRQMALCRYLEELYNRIMETGGGMSEEMMERLDEAYIALLGGTPRKG
ncbi:MAG: hypothetical protein JSW58_15390 [Candidatus Latescibacterota bacterium]|nr:MAG: hypothetical protein JSW58_15390 [Candidatus Latescibacterota bacterium]